MQHLLAANITEPGICDFCGKYNTHAVFSPERERQTDRREMEFHQASRSYHQAPGNTRDRGTCQ